MQRSMSGKISIFNIFVLLLVLVLPIVFSESAQAANFAQVYMRLDRLAASATTGGLVCADPATTASTEADVQVTFPTGFGVNTTAANWDVNTSNLPSGTTAWPGIGGAGSEASSVSGSTVTFASDDLTNASAIYCFNFVGTSTLTNPSANNNLSGTITTRASGPSTIDSSNYALSIITNDQIVVSATVPPTFTFTLSGNTDVFSTDLSTSSVVSTSGKTVTVSTNAAQGWVAWVKSANAALNSVSTGASIATAGSIDDAPTDLNPTTGYVMDVNLGTTAGNCTIAQNPGYGDEYDGLNTDSGGTLSTTFQPVAECTGGASDGENFAMVERAFISSTQAAATDYTDTLTVVAAGRF